MHYDDQTVEDNSVTCCKLFSFNMSV